MSRPITKFKSYLQSSWKAMVVNLRCLQNFHQFQGKNNFEHLKYLYSNWLLFLYIYRTASSFQYYASRKYTNYIFLVRQQGMSRTFLSMKNADGILFPLILLCMWNETGSKLCLSFKWSHFS